MGDRDYCFLVPALPGKIDDLRRFWREAGGGNAGEMDRYIRSIGQNRLLECLQTLPQGKVLVTYVQEPDDLGTTFARNRTQGTSYADRVRDAFINFSGVDFTLPETLPRVEKLRAWEDPDYAGRAARYSAFAVPILPGRTDAARQFFTAARTGEKTDEEAPVFRYQTVAKMASFLQHRPEGDYLLEYVESEKPLDEVMRLGLSSGRQISEFIRSGFSAFSALPLPLAPDIEVLFDWDARGGNRATAAPTAHT